MLVVRRLPGTVAAATAGLLLAAAHAEALRAPVPFSSDDYYRGVPPIFEALDTPEPGAVVIFPFYGPERIFLNARYMLVSTAFWKPMLNGYSGYRPKSYIEHTRNLGGFPDRRSLDYVTGLGVTRVLVDSRSMPTESLERLGEFPELTMIGTDGNLRIYALEP
jgi:hypothetical protein